MATKRKQHQNLELPSTTKSNYFAILNTIDDDMLLQNAKELDIALASDEEGSSRDGNSGTSTRYLSGTQPDGVEYGDNFLPTGGTRTRTETGTGLVFFSTRG
jgi:hypothetical protein